MGGRVCMEGGQVKVCGRTCLYGGWKGKGVSKGSAIVWFTILVMVLDCGSDVLFCVAL